MKVFLTIVFLLLPIISSGEASEIRDKYGNLIYTKDRQGSETDIRDKYGNLIGTERDSGNRREFRDKYGNVDFIEEEDR